MKCQSTDKELDFDLHEEADLSLFKTDHANKLVEAQMDDDVQTDDEQECGAKKVLLRELENAILTFVDGSEDGFVHNLDPEKAKLWM